MILPVALSSHATTPSSDKNKRVGTVPLDKPGKKTKSIKADHSDETADSSVVHSNRGMVPEWKLPTGIEYLDLFNTKMPGLKGWPVLVDDRIPKKTNRTQKAPMCVRFQAVGKCKQGCSLSHVMASDMPDSARAKAATLFQAVYTGT